MAYLAWILRVLSKSQSHLPLTLCRHRKLPHLAALTSTPNHYPQRSRRIAAAHFGREQPQNDYCQIVAQLSWLTFLWGCGFARLRYKFLMAPEAPPNSSLPLAFAFMHQLNNSMWAWLHFDSFPFPEAAGRRLQVFECVDFLPQ